LDFLARTRLLNYMLPELAVQVDFDQDSPYHELTLWEHSVKTVRLSPAEVNVRWAALLHDSGKPYTRTVNKHGYSNYVHHEAVGAELATKVGHYLHWSKQRIQEVHDLVLHHLEPGSPIGDADGQATKR
ncbi:MAG TPA: HD domain-containing protein, partial [Candidatus Saccharimonadales bacterium]|nr:HD domain-containing protein [Candidatus Saccharimonadales bacterium]